LEHERAVWLFTRVKGCVGGGEVGKGTFKGGGKGSEKMSTFRRGWLGNAKPDYVDQRVKVGREEVKIEEQ
jgi:hypothetical protein